MLSEKPLAVRLGDAVDLVRLAAAAGVVLAVMRNRGAPQRRPGSHAHRARFGEPPDDWILLAVTSGPHLEAVLEIIARTTTTSLEDLRTACEVRDAIFIAEDLHIALHQPKAPAWIATRIDDLEELIGRRWWRRTR